MTYEQLADLATATLYNDEKKKIVNIDASLLRNYPAANRLVRKNVVKEQGGLDHRWRVNVTGNSSATHFGPFHTVDRTVGDHLKTASMVLKNTRADFSYDALEPEFNGGEYEVVDVIKNREQQAKIALTAQIEQDSWGFAASTDDATPQGLLYWFPQSTTALSTTGGSNFNGTGCTGYTTNVAGLSPSTYTGWKSWATAYVNVTDDDLFLAMRNAFIDTKFQAPINPMLVMDGVDHQWALYVNKTTILQFENQCKLQNDNIGNDLSYFSGRAMFGRIPLEEVPTLGTTFNTFATRNPVFGINWGAIENHVRKNWWMKTERVAQNPDQPLTVSFDIYCCNQIIVRDRRQGGFHICINV